MARHTPKQLTCPACGVIIAEAVLQRWPGNLLVTSVDGYEIQPLHVGLLLRLAAQELAGATTPRQQSEAENRLAFLRRNVTELVYDLHCRNGHRILRTMPQIARSLRRSSGNWISLD